MMSTIIRNNYDTLALLFLMLFLCFFTCRGTGDKTEAYKYATISAPSEAYCEYDSLADTTNARQDSINRAFDMAIRQAKKDRVQVVYQAPIDTLRIKVTRVSPHFGEINRK